jgi:hypothetical protein
MNELMEAGLVGAEGEEGIGFMEEGEKGVPGAQMPYQENTRPKATMPKKDASKTGIAKKDPKIGEAPQPEEKEKKGLFKKLFGKKEE